MTQTRKRIPAGPACCPGLAEALEPEFFQALCDPSRVGILVRTALRGEAATVGEIASGTPVSLSVVSRHLATLRRAGIVEARRQGREVRYRVRYGPLAATLRAIADAFESCCPPPAGRGGRKKGR